MIDQHQLLVDAICGVDPPLSLVGSLESRGLGHWTGGFHDRWDWTKTAVSSLDTAQLNTLYIMLRSGAALGSQGNLGAGGH